MLTIKPLTVQDIPAARRLSDAAGWNQLDQDWDRLITLWPQTTIGGWLNDQLIATASLAYFDPIPGGSNRLAWIGVMLVDPAHRGAGHGGKMFDAALLAGADRGIIDYGLDATDMGRPVYLKRNFTDRFGMNRWSCPKPILIPNRNPAIRPIAPTDWPQVIALDQHATQVKRGPLLQRFAGEPGVHTVIAEAAGKISGFGILRPGRVAADIGPIVAADTPTANALCDALIQSHNNPAAPLFADVGAGSRLEPHLTARGFAIARKLIRMAKASTECPLAHSPQTYAIAGLELC